MKGVARMVSRAWLLPFLLSSVGAMLTSGQVKANDPKSFIYMNKFCFGNTGSGAAKIEISLKNKVAGGLLVFWDDTLWNEMYDNAQGRTCQQLATLAEASVQHRWATNIDPGESTMQVTVSDRARPHFWFMAAINCEGPLDFEYSVTFLNTPDGWQEQFSFDVQGALLVYSVFCLFSLALAVTHHYGHFSMQDDASRLPTVRLIKWALWSMPVVDICYIIHLSVYASDGVGLPFVALGGSLVYLLGQALLLFLLLLIAQGWTVHQIQIQNRNKLVIALGSFLLAGLILLSWDVCCRDRAHTVYSWDSWAGLARLIVTLGVFFWFQKLTLASYNAQYDEFKRKAYLVFGFGGSFWFTMGPVTVLIASLLDPWVRARAVVIMHRVADALTISAITYAVWPTRAEKFFQLHVGYEDVNVGGITGIDVGYEDI